MASYTIMKRKKADGSIRYTARVRVKKLGAVVYNESRTFSKKGLATEWGKRKVFEIEDKGYDGKVTTISVGEMVGKYLNDPHVDVGRTKRNVLEFIMDCDIALENASKLQAHHIVDHCKVRNEAGAGPATLTHDVSYLRGVLRSAKPMWGYDVDDICVIEALPVPAAIGKVWKTTWSASR